MDLLQLMVARLPPAPDASRLDDVIIGFICYYLEGERASSGAAVFYHRIHDLILY